ncbi:MAG: hypothetical protein LQ337_006327 [Flavoplaca oasis]|nr:MAG: hypothetical protein LQ337_006327 [Flavoplaca oasis]
MAPLDLLSLPNEIITQVIDELDLTDTWSVAQTSKAIHHVSQPAMKRHRVYKAEFSLVRLGEPYMDNDDTRFEGSLPLVFLEQVIREPRIASYLTDLRLSLWSDVPDDDFRAEQQLPAVILAAIYNCPYIVDEVALLMPKGQAHQVAFLLTLLPNLRSMAMRCMCDEIVPVAEMVWNIVQVNHNMSSAAQGKALSKLTKISIEHHDTENGQDVVLFAPFMSLPSMRSLCGRMIRGEIDGYPCTTFHDFRAVEHSQMDEIEMLYSSIDSAIWELILKPIENLKRLTYEHAGAIVGNAEYDGLGITEHLRKYASHSLQHLDLTCDLGYNEEDQFVGDLKGFKLLRTLRLNAKAFCPKVDNWRSRPEVEYDRMADTLPTSIQAVTLVGGFANDGPLDLAKLIEERHKLPELTRIDLEGAWDLTQSHLDLCKSVGIEVVVKT